ncbi:hypothetical protein ES705_45703 [subsurface metagenome]
MVIINIGRVRKVIRASLKLMASIAVKIKPIFNRSPIMVTIPYEMNSLIASTSLVILVITAPTGVVSK